MARADRSEVVNLMPTARARGDDDCPVRLPANGVCQWFRDFQGEFVFGSKRAKRAGHTATAGVKKRGFTGVQTFGEAFHESHVHERFGVAVRVNDDIGWLGIEREGIRIAAEDAFNETFEKEAASGDLLGIWQAEFAIIFDEH